LSVDDGVSTNYRNASFDATCNIQAAKKNEDSTSGVAFYLNRAEYARGVVDLLPLSHKNVLIEIGAVAMRLSLSERSREQDREQRECS